MIPLSVHGTVGASTESTPAPWTPSFISTTLWLDADDSSTLILVSGAVSQWSDKSGNNRHFTQSNSSNRPTLATLDNKNVVYFSNQFLVGVSALSVLSNSQYEIFLVVRLRSVTSTSSSWIYQHPYLIGDSAGYFGVAVRQFLNSYSPIHVAHGIYNSGQVRVDSTNDIALNQWYIVRAFRKTSSPEINVEVSTENSSVSSTRTLSNSTSTLYLARNQFQGLNTECDIAEIITTNYSLTTSDAQKIEGYLAHKWGLTASLPSNHPYKNSPPTS